MKDTIAKLVGRALAALPELHDQPELATLDPEIERARDARHGDFASNVALRLAKPARCSPRRLAESIVAHLPDDPAIARVEVAGPGFINFFVTDDAAHAVVADIHRLGERYGYAEPREQPKVLVEYVSANPTGPLHVGHGRLAAYGATLANLLRAAGYPVDEEYYVNDAGRQMEIIAVSVWVRFLQAGGAVTAAATSPGSRRNYPQRPMPAVSRRQARTCWPTCRPTARATRVKPTSMP